MDRWMDHRQPATWNGHAHGAWKQRFHTLALVITLGLAVVPAWSESAPFTAFGGAVVFSPDPDWMIERHASAEHGTESYSGRKDYFPGKGRGHRSLSLNLATFTRINLKPSIEAARDAALENIKANQQHGNRLTLVESRQLTPSAWYLLIDRSEPGKPLGEIPQSHEFEHVLHYVVPGRTMFIQLRISCPVVQKDVLALINRDAERLLATFVVDGQPMFPFGAKPPVVPP